ncbi:MAG: glycosyltransferase [bacterium]|nr:glycosyltransferase [bacterium]MDZ4286204.1 glycosyltransferase [Candidatus Sungbacteria bacterium]
MSNHEFLHYKSLDSAHPRRISYLIFTRNRGARLNDTIEDVGTFIRPEDELIIADGASTDSTEEVVLRHRNIVHIFLSEKDRSGMHGLNKAVLLAGGKYVVILPDDDRVRGDGAEKAFEAMEKNPHIDLLVCGGTKHFLTRNTTSTFYYGPGMNYGSNVELQCIYGSCANGFFIRRSTFAKVGLFPLDSVAWDPMWVVQCIYHGGVVKFARINFFDHYVTDDSISHNMAPQMRAQRIRFAKMYCSSTFARVYGWKQSPVYRMSIGPVRDFAHRAQKIIRKGGVSRLFQWTLVRLKKGAGRKRQPAPPVWDGGFS